MSDKKRRAALSQETGEFDVPSTTQAPVSAFSPMALQSAGGGGNDAVQSLISGYAGDGKMDAGEHTDTKGNASYGSTPNGWVDDIMTAVDRMSAAAELRSDYKIVDGSKKGKRKPNEVTQEEFDHLTTLYSDIRRDKTNFKFDTVGMNPTDAGNFKSGVMGDMKNMLTTKVGRDLLDDLAYGKNKNGKAYTTTLSQASNIQGTKTSSSIGNIGNAANGVGVDQTVAYMPGKSVDLTGGDPKKLKKEPWAKATSDVVLFHELTHALHRRDGTMALKQDAHGNYYQPEVGRKQATTPKDAHVHQEEYNTTGLGKGKNLPITENVYRKQRSEVTGTTIPKRKNYKLK